MHHSGWIFLLRIRPIRTTAKMRLVKSHVKSAWLRYGSTRLSLTLILLTSALPETKNKRLVWRR